jgi:uroporphyrinogen III methyltransferase/synthase
MKKGKVYLVGAGPGDIGLLTIKGLRCLRKADVIVYDYHVNGQVLNYVSRGAEFIYAGKRGGHHEKSQDEINGIIVEKARQGKAVCRLKGGDPFVFGRGGEEAEVLSRAGIEFEVIPGVTSVVAAPACAGIPLTHRDYSSSFAVVTGNEAITKNGTSISWPALAASRETLVFLMAVKNIAAITGRLIDAGKPSETPVAVIRWGARPEQETVVATLGTVADVVEQKRIRPPAVMVVGNVVKLRDRLAWYENKPLFGHRILITREYSGDFEPLEDLGAEIFEFPTVRIDPPASFKELDSAIARISEYDWLVFTSANGVRSFMTRYVDGGSDVRDMKGVRLCAIGSKTAAAVKKYGMNLDLVPEEFHSEGLIEAFLHVAGSQNLQGTRILLPRAESAREVFPDAVRSLGGHIDTPVAYRAAKPESHGRRLKRFLFEGRISIATFTSSATFTNFVEMLGSDALPFLHGVTIAAIGPVTKRTIESSGLPVAIMPGEATNEALVAEIIRWVADNKGLRHEGQEV